MTFLIWRLRTKLGHKVPPRWPEPPLTTALRNFTQVDIKSVFRNRQPLSYAEGLKSNLPKSSYTKDDCVCFCVCLVCFVNIRLPVNY